MSSYFEKENKLTDIENVLCVVIINNDYQLDRI